MVSNKKKVLILSIVVTALALVTGLDVSASTNLIVNGDFEQGEVGWNSRNKGEISSIESYLGGSHSGVLTPNAISNGKANGYIGQVVSVEPNTTYTVTAYGKTDKNGAVGYFTARWFDNGKQGDIVLGKDGDTVDQPIQSTQWTKYSYTFNSGNHHKVLIQLVKWSDEATTKVSSIFIDQVVMTKEETTYYEKWRDDFEGEVLNRDSWGYELGSIRGIEQQHYVSDLQNVFLRNGELVLRVTDRPQEDIYPNPRNIQSKVIYNSGSVRTHGKQELLYGNLEIKAKLPQGKGVFPAFWMLGADFVLDGKINDNQGHGWPSTGEIDIMELVGDAQSGSYANRTVYQTLHYGAEQNDNGKFAGNGKAYTLSSGSFNDDYHIFALDWYKDRMVWLVDGKVVRTVDYSNDPLASAIFNKPQYAQLNLAVGGAWPGPVANNLSGTEFVIDYISYSRNEEQEIQAKEYYDKAPQINGATDITINKGDTPDLLAKISTNDNSYMVDYSIDDEFQFKNTGGNTNVRLMVSGKQEKEKIATLPPGKYNIHYSAFPNVIDFGSRIARKTVTLTVVE